jgi:conjugative transposon TraN protein
MRNFVIWLTSVALVCTAQLLAYGQIENNRLTISFAKTTSLVFPFSITSVDRGSKDVLAQKAPGVENVLQVKAGRKDFPETNLTVITADGTLHQFEVSYSEDPSVHAMTIAVTDARPLILVKDAINERTIRSDSKNVLAQKMGGKIDQNNKYQMVLALQDIFIHDNVLYFRIHIGNNSSINFDVKSLKFIIKDRKKVKRTSSQELEITPVYIGNPTESIAGFGSRTIVYAVKKFTIPDDKLLNINLFEEYGGRNLRLKVKNRDILNATLLPITKDLITVN